VVVSAKITDESMVVNATLFYTVNGKTYNVSMQLTSGNASDGYWQATLPRFRARTVVTYYVLAYDMYNNSATSETYSYKVRYHGGGGGGGGGGPSPPPPTPPTPPPEEGQGYAIPNMREIALLSLFFLVMLLVFARSRSRRTA